jgi:hypothetical protein
MEAVTKTNTHIVKVKLFKMGCDMKKSARNVPKTIALGPVSERYPKISIKIKMSAVTHVRIQSILPLLDNNFSMGFPLFLFALI